MKTCQICKIDKEESSFGKDKSKFDGYRIYCSDCLKKQYRLRHPQKEKIAFNYNLWRKNNRQKLKISNPNISLLESSKYRARKLGIQHTLKISDIKIPTICPVFGIPLQVSSKRPSHNSPSIDRIDNNKGYTPDNIVIVSWRANDLKRDAQISELEKLVNFYKTL
jgi:hypothetical protein